MAFDKTKDKLIDCVELEVGESKFVELGIYSYDGGEPKLQMTRFSINMDEERSYGKLGRLTFDELELIQEALPDIMQKMEDSF